MNYFKRNDRKGFYINLEKKSIARALRSANDSNKF